MRSSPPADYNELLLRLYRLSHELPLDAFQDAALELVKPVLPFDSSMWGSATLTSAGIDVHTIHLHRQPPEMLQAYEELKHLDTAASLVAQAPASALAFHADSWFGAPTQKALRAHGKRFGQAHFFIGADLNAQTHFTRWLTLFRANERAYCTESERLLLAGLMPHLQQALELNRLTHLSQVAGVAGRATRGTAIADLRGVLHHADAAFEQALRAEGEGWHGHALPAGVMKVFQQGASRFTGRSHVVTRQVEHQLLFLQSRPRCAADRLTPREFTVAKLVARGNTHKEIAAMFKRSPATVSSQIRTCYDKLAVGNVAGLIEALRLAE